MAVPEDAKVSVLVLAAFSLPLSILASALLLVVRISPFGSIIVDDLGFICFTPFPMARWEDEIPGFIVVSSEQGNMKYQGSK